MTDVFRLAQCPRCTNWCNMAMPALSRRDNKTAICSACGTDEAMREYLNIPDKEWSSDYLLIPAKEQTA